MMAGIDDEAFSLGSLLDHAARDMAGDLPGEPWPESWPNRGYALPCLGLTGLMPAGIWKRSLPLRVRGISL